MEKKKRGKKKRNKKNKSVIMNQNEMNSITDSINSKLQGFIDDHSNDVLGNYSSTDIINVRNQLISHGILKPLLKLFMVSFKMIIWLYQYCRYQMVFFLLTKLTENISFFKTA